MKYPLSRSSLLGALGATTALVALALARGGDSGNDVTTTAPAATTPSNTASAGVMVAKDPVTGALRAATAEEMAALQPATADPKGARREAPLRSEQLANGAVVTTLDRSYDLNSVASKDSNGKIREACVPGYQLEATLKAAQNGAVNTEEVVDEK